MLLPNSWSCWLWNFDGNASVPKQTPKTILALKTSWNDTKPLPPVIRKACACSTSRFAFWALSKRKELLLGELASFQFSQAFNATTWQNFQILLQISMQMFTVQVTLTFTYGYIASEARVLASLHKKCSTLLTSLWKKSAVKADGGYVDLPLDRFDVPGNPTNLVAAHTVPPGRLPMRLAVCSQRRAVCYKCSCMQCWWLIDNEWYWLAPKSSLHRIFFHMFFMFLFFCTSKRLEPKAIKWQVKKNAKYPGPDYYKKEGKWGP